MQIKATAIQNLPDSTWTFLSGEANETDIDTLYSTVSWLYRCVTIRGNSVASMPFEVRKNGEVVYQFNGITEEDAPPKDLKWISQLPPLLGLVEVASVLGGCAYIERQKNVLSKDLSLKWFLPWSVEPIYNGVSGMGGMATDESQPYGSLLGFWRTNPQQGKPIRLDAEQVAYFWFPDHAVEIGKAKNYPAQSVLNNAGVIGSLDYFLQGYFERGLIKATLLKYKDQLHETERKRVKEWWKRIFSGVANSHVAEVVRGDFEAVEIGEGIKDLRDNVLLHDEQKSIAVGMGIPLSKLDSTVATDANRKGDETAYIEDTVIPEIVWIYRVLNSQILNDLGYSIVALPQQLRVMQSDEVDRSQAFSNYVNGGYTVDEAESILGIYLPDDIKEKASQERAENRERLQQTSQENDSIPENEENKPEIDEKSAKTAIKEPQKVDFIALMDKKEERDQYLRWLKKRGHDADLTKFNTKYLSEDEKENIYTTWVENSEVDAMIDDFADAMKKLKDV